MKNMGTFLKRTLIITTATVTIPVFSSLIKSKSDVFAVLEDTPPKEEYSITFFENEMTRR